MKVRNLTLQQKYALDSLILSKLAYNTENHPYESCEWLNVLIAQFVATYRNDPLFLKAVTSQLECLFNKEQIPNFVVKFNLIRDQFQLLNSLWGKNIQNLETRELNFLMMEICKSRLISNTMTKLL